MRRPELPLCLRFLTATLLLWLAVPGSAAALADGPYLIRQTRDTWLARSVAGDEATPRVIEQKIETGESFTVAGVGSLPSFTVHVRAREAAAADTVTLKQDTPVFVIADTHGEYAILGELLQKQRIVDASLHWSFGKGQVVVLGDVFDRGANQIEILWLFYELQAQAAEAGGALHLLIGNHEAMVLGGDLRYLNPKYVRTADVLKVDSYRELLGPDTLLGQWLRTRPAVLRIGELLCLHGGVSPELVRRGLGLQQINSTVRDVLNETALSTQSAEQAKFLMGPLGPLWYRGYFADSSERPAASDDIDRILTHFGVAKILVGHTRVPTVTALYGQRVIAVQVYPHRDEASGAPVMEALRIERGRFLRARIDGAVEPLN